MMQKITFIVWRFSSYNTINHLKTEMNNETSFENTTTKGLL